MQRIQSKRSQDKECLENAFKTFNLDYTMLIYRFTLILVFVAFQLTTLAQLTSTGCPGLADYPNSDPSDTIFFFHIDSLGDLTATPPSGLPPFTFNWSYYNVGTTSWESYASESNIPYSTIDNLPEGAYAISITDATNNVIFCDIAWIGFVDPGSGTDGYVDVLPIPPSCTSAHLVGVIVPPTSSPAYSLIPPNPMFVDASTEIQICFSGTHTWVSDLGFYLVGPASCGSPTVLLSPNPGSIGQGTICNSGDNISNLCFTTESAGNLNVCQNPPFTLSGTYNSYGPSSTPINWSTVYGCDVTNAGWSVQIYDCISGDTGFLTDATLTFTGNDLCGDPQTVSYTTPPGFSSFIADNSCSPQLASIFSVPPPAPPAPITCDWTYEWSSDPYVYIADSTTSLDFYISLPFYADSAGTLLNPQPDTVLFTLTYYNECTGQVDTTSSTCLGGSGGFMNSDSELFVVLPYSNSIIYNPGILCFYGSDVMLTAAPPGGIWSGSGIVDPIMGIFSPGLAGIGSHAITYTPFDECVYPTTTVVFVVDISELVILPAGPFCIDDPPYTLFAISNGEPVNWFGPGVSFNGTFDPSVAGPGIHEIIASSFADCGDTSVIYIEVSPLPNVNAGPDQNICSNESIQLNATGALTYLWSPASDLTDPLIANPISTTAVDIVYTVTGTNAFGCSAADDISLTVIPPPVLETNEVEPICPGDFVDLIATGTNGTFSWSPATDVVNPGVASTLANPSSTIEYTATLTDICGQTLTSSVQVVVDIPVQIAFENSSYAICEGETAIVNALISGNFDSIEWTTANGSLETSEIHDPTIHVSTSGTYTLTAITAMGCNYANSVNLEVIPLPEPNLPPTIQFCPGGSTTLNAGNWDTALWSTEETTNSIEVNTPGIYSVIVTENGCSASDSIWVEEISMPILNLGPDIAICEGSSVELSIDVAGIWNSSIEDSSITVTSAGSYYVSYSDGPCTVSDSILVSILPLPQANLGPDITGCIDNPVILSAFATMNTAYYWSTSENTSEIEVLEPGLYSVTTTNTCGEAEDVIAVFFEDCSYQLFIPNTFTPDKDGINDVWQISTYRVKTIDIRIFNRWGDILYKSQNPKEAWTGEAQEGEHYVQDGPYAYYIRFETEDGETGERSGHVNIIR